MTHLPFGFLVAVREVQCPILHLKPLPGPLTQLRARISSRWAGLTLAGPRRAAASSQERCCKELTPVSVPGEAHHHPGTHGGLAALPSPCSLPTSPKRQTRQKTTTQPTQRTLLTPALTQPEEHKSPFTSPTALSLPCLLRQPRPDPCLNSLGHQDGSEDPEVLGEKSSGLPRGRGEDLKFLLIAKAAHDPSPPPRARQIGAAARAGHLINRKEQMINVCFK